MMASRTLTILLVDIKGFTPKAAASSRQEITELLEKFRALIKPLITRCGGKIIKELGDAFLVTFESPTNAVAAGTLLQQLFRDRNKGVPEDQRIEVRVAIHSGEVDESGGDVIGDAVNIASRVESVTEVGEVYFTESVFLTMNRNEVPSSEVGERVLKGVPQPVKLYRVLQDPADDRYWRLLAGGGAVWVGGRRRRKTLLWVAAATLLAAASAGGALLLAGMDPALSGARRLAAEGRHADAVEALTRAYEKEVPPPEALELIEDCGTKAVEKLLAEKDFATARELAYRWSERCSHLRELPVRVVLAEVDHLVASGQAGDAVEPLEAAAKKHDSWRLHTALSRLYARKDVWVKGPGKRLVRGWYYQAVDEIRKAVPLAPAGKPLPEELKAELWARFAGQPPTGSSAISWNAGELCKLVAKHLWPEYREKLVAGAASPDHALRVNSMTVLKITGAEGKADAIAHHAWNMSYGYWSAKRKEAAEYLRGLKAPADRKRAMDLLSGVRSKLEKSTSYSDQRALKELDELVAAMKSAS